MFVGKDSLVILMFNMSFFLGDTLKLYILLCVEKNWFFFLYVNLRFQKDMSGFLEIIQIGQKIQDILGQFLMDLSEDELGLRCESSVLIFLTDIPLCQDSFLHKKYNYVWLCFLQVFYSSETIFGDNG